MSKYPLILALGVPVMKNTWNDTGPRLIVDADKLEAALAKAPVVWACESPVTNTLHYAQPVDATHTSRLVCIRPIKQKSREEQLEELVREILDSDRQEGIYSERCREAFRQARKLLGEK